MSEFSQLNHGSFQFCYVSLSLLPVSSDIVLWKITIFTGKTTILTGKITIFPPFYWENHHFTGEITILLEKSAFYWGNHPIFTGETDDFDWAIFNSYDVRGGSHPRPAWEAALRLGLQSSIRKRSMGCGETSERTNINGNHG